MIDFILRPVRRNFGKDKMFFRAIDDMFGFIPNNIELYKLALIHKSASITLDNGQHINNERLEFLGDAIIESVSSDYLFIEFPDKNEGFLTQMRSKMVSRQSLNAVAKRIGLDDHVITNSTNNSAQKHIYGDAFEAMMGAIYLDQGYDFVNRLLINKIFAQYLKMDTLLESETDFKSRLIEWCQKNHHTIHFATSHDKTYSSSHPFFYSKVLIDNIEVGYGAGESKKEAEQRAAHSVSQGFNDEDCTKLMDRLDNIDGRQQNNSSERSSAKQRENAAPKLEKTTNKAEKSAPAKSEKTVSNKSEPPATESSANVLTEPEKPKRKPRRNTKSDEQTKEIAEQNSNEVAEKTKPEAKENSTKTPVEEVAKDKANKGANEVAETPKKAIRKPTIRTPKKPANDSTKSSDENIVDEPSVDSADGNTAKTTEQSEQTPKPKTRSRRRRSPKDKAAQATETPASEDRASEPKNAPTSDSQTE